MKVFLPEIDKPFTIDGVQIRPDDDPGQYREKLARITLNEMRQSVAVLSNEGILLECNRAALNRSGLTREEVIGKQFWEILWWTASTKTQQDLRAAILRAAQGELVRYEVEEFARQSGNELAVMDFSLLPVKDETGRVVFLLAEARVITGKKTHEPEIERQREHLAGRSEAEGANLSKPPPGTAPGNEKPRVLWAASETEIPSQVMGILSELFLVQPVSDGEAALEAARAHPPEVILADADLSRLDGFGLLRAVRSDPVLQDIPVILMSPRTDEESRTEAIEAGAAGYVVKPYGARELADRIDTYVRIARMTQAAEAALQESEERFRRIANSAPTILWITGLDGGCSFVSRAWYEYTGQTEQAALGLGWLEMVHPEDREQTNRAVNEALRKREPFSQDLRLRRQTGEFRWVLNSGGPRFSADGTFEGFTGSVIDIHERKQAAEASLLLSAIVDSSDDAIISKDLNAIITSWNKGAERLFGYTAAEAIGRSITMLIPPDRQDEEPKILERLRRGERVDHFETIRVRKDGTLLNISLTISPVRDSRGKIVGASKIARDITERVRQQEALERANAALQQANADLQQFAYSASHDLQEPLRMVAAYSELLQKKFGGKLGPAADEYIGHTVQGAVRMENLLRDLRIYTQLSTNEFQNPEEIDAGEVLQATAASLDVAVKDSGAVITAGDLQRVRMHRFQLEQVFQNLIGNAIRYRSSRPPRIHVAAEQRGHEYLFSVQDNGIGIEPQFKEQIFGIFKRLHSVAEYPGTGMGLAICQRIIDRAGGRIWVDSEPGHGSTFYFTIPCGKPGPGRTDPPDVLDSAGRGQHSGRGVGP